MQNQAPSSSAPFSGPVYDFIELDDEPLRVSPGYSSHLIDNLPVYVDQRVYRPNSSWAHSQPDPSVAAAVMERIQATSATEPPMAAITPDFPSLSPFVADIPRILPCFPSSGSAAVPFANSTSQSPSLQSSIPPTPASPVDNRFVRIHSLLQSHFDPANGRRFDNAGGSNTSSSSPIQTSPCLDLSTVCTGCPPNVNPFGPQTNGGARPRASVIQMSPSSGNSDRGSDSSSREGYAAPGRSEGRPVDYRSRLALQEYVRCMQRSPRVQMLASGARDIPGPPSSNGSSLPFPSTSGSTSALSPEVSYPGHSTARAAYGEYREARSRALNPSGNGVPPHLLFTPHVPQRTERDWSTQTGDSSGNTRDASAALAPGPFLVPCPGLPDTHLAWDDHTYRSVVRGSRRAHRESDVSASAAGRTSGFEAVVQQRQSLRSAALPYARPASSSSDERYSPAVSAAELLDPRAGLFRAMMRSDMPRIERRRHTEVTVNVFGTRFPQWAVGVNEGKHGSDSSSNTAFAGTTLIGRTVCKESSLGKEQSFYRGGDFGGERLPVDHPLPTRYLQRPQSHQDLRTEQLLNAEQRRRLVYVPHNQPGNYGRITASLLQFMDTGAIFMHTDGEPKLVLEEDVIAAIAVDTQSFKFDHQFPHTEECIICFEEFELQQDVRVLSCSQTHRFHKHCIDKWLIKNKPNCPICRQILPSLNPPKDTIPIIDHPMSDPAILGWAVAGPSQQV